MCTAGLWPGFLLGVAGSSQSATCDVRRAERASESVLSGAPKCAQVRPGAPWGPFVSFRACGTAHRVVPCRERMERRQWCGCELWALARVSRRGRPEWGLAGESVDLVPTCRAPQHCWQRNRPLIRSTLFAGLSGESIQQSGTRSQSWRKSCGMNSPIKSANDGTNGTDGGEKVKCCWAAWLGRATRWGQQDGVGKQTGLAWNCGVDLPVTSANDGGK